jgi:phage I-like protein
MSIKAAFLKVLGLMNLSDDQKKIAEDAIKDLPENDPPPPAGGNDPKNDALMAEIRELRAENKELRDLFGDERKSREESQKALAERAKKEADARIEKILDDAIKEGKIEPGQRDSWKKRLALDVDEIETVIKERTPNPALVKKDGDNKEGDKKTVTDQPSDARKLIEAAENEFA